MCGNGSKEMPEASDHVVLPRAENGAFGRADREAMDKAMKDAAENQVKDQPTGSGSTPAKTPP
jgi:hypothetical protein